MASKDKSPQLAIGFRVKTGRATAIVMAGPASTPRVLSRRSLQLWDPVIPESHQPFHAELELPPAESARVVPQALKAVERVALSALRELVDEIQPALGSILGIALVAVRIVFAAESACGKSSANRFGGPRGRARACEVPALTLVESEVFTSAAAKLGKSPDAIKLAVTELGRAVGKPWSAEEKAAAAAAWIVLADR